GLGHQGANADAVGARRFWSDDVHAGLALPGRVARVARASRLPGNRLLRLVRPPPLPRRRRHGLDRAQAALEQLDLVADGDFARLDHAREHPALVVELGSQALAQVVHALARVADHRDLEDRLADTDALPDRPALDVGAVDGQVLADRPRFDADGLEVLHRREQHLAPRRIRVRAA